MQLLSIYLSKEALFAYERQKHCIYWGTDPWAGPRDLHDMLDIPPKLKHHKDRIGNYPLNLLEIRAIPDLEQYEGELKALFGFLKYQILSVMGNMRNLNKYVNRHDDNNNNQKEGFDVCQAIEEMMNDSKEEGRLEGRLEGIHALIEDNLEDGKSMNQIHEKLQRRFSLTPEKAQQYLDEYQAN